MIQGETRTKIAVTIGVASRNREIVREMVLAGARIFRINFSHGSVEEWRESVRIVREIEAELGMHLALVGDLPGPSVRVGILDEPVEVKAGEFVRLVPLNKAHGGDEKVIPLPNEVVLRALRRGHVILMDDGLAVFEVESASASEAVLKALTDARISSRKSMVVRGRDLDLPTISSREVEIVKFAAAEEFDYIGLSYVRGEHDVAMLRGMLLSLGAEQTSIIAKIEVPAAVKNLGEIVDAADAILVARGDLGMHFPLEEVPRLQSMIVRKSIERGKPVIVATQLLGSMIENPVPTRSEVVDVVAAVSEGVDVLMLTNETAVGKYPVEAVKWLRKIIERYEPGITPPRRSVDPKEDIRTRFAYGVASLAESLNAAMLVYTISGRTAQRIAGFRPSVSIIAASPIKRTLRRLMLLRGVETIEVSSTSYEDGLSELEKKIMGGEIRVKEPTVVLTYGMREELVHLVKIIHLGSGAGEHQLGEESAQTP
ncbi:MAG: pyruvate kinase [Thaumarchaeota archaeon]|nr:pyruvate kinase [Candidatus Wolframiiraptor allenii]